MRRFGLILGFVASLAAGSAFAQSTVTATNAGFLSTGAIISGGPDAMYLTGHSGGEYRSFMTFSVPVSGTAFTSAVLNLNVATVAGGPNDLAIYDVTSDILADAPAAVFNDLESGVLFGTATGLSGGGTVQITLNPDGLAAVNAARGSTISFGFVNSTNSGSNDYIFAGSNDTTPRELILTPAAVPPTPVPTLNEWAMILFATLMAGGAAVYLQRRRQVA